MKKMHVFLFFLSCLCLISFAFISGCGESPSPTSGTPAPRLYYGTDITGEPVACSIGDGTFSATWDSGVHISGTYIKLGSGVLSGEVNASNDTSLIGKILNFIEMHNVLLLAKGPDEQLLICPARTSTALTGNYVAVLIPQIDWRPEDQRAFVTAEMVAASDYNIEVTDYTFTSRSPGGFSQTGYIFSNGKYINPSDPLNRLHIFQTHAGMFVLGDPDLYVTLIGTKKGTINTFEAISRTYTGLTIITNPFENTREASAIIVKPSSAQTNWMNAYLMNLDTGSPGTLIGTFEIGAQDPNMGVIPSVLWRGSSHNTLEVTALNVSGKYVLTAISSREGDGWPINFILVQP